MKIKEIIRQHRRDFTAIYECEHCGFTHEGSGYDDANFHNVAIPKKKCPECNKVAGKEYRALTTKYPAGKVV